MASGIAKWQLYFTGNREAFKERLEEMIDVYHGNGATTDYNGFFASLFTEDELTPGLLTAFGLDTNM